MMMSKWFFLIVVFLFSFYGCSNHKTNKLVLNSKNLPLKIVFNDAMGLVILSPIENSNREYSSKEIGASLCSLVQNNSALSQKSLLLLKDFSLYNKVSNDACASEDSHNCSILKKNWLGLYNDSRTITTFPYDREKRKYLKCAMN